MNDKTMKELKEATNKLIGSSILIEGMYEKLLYAELEKGIDSKEYKDLFDVLRIFLKLEYNIISKILDTPFCLYFVDIIKKNKCNRLYDLIKNDYDLYKMLLIGEYKAEYDAVKDDYELSYSQEDYVNHKLQKEDFKLLTKNVLNFKKDKMYIRVLDFYINNTDDHEIKKLLLEEKYNTIKKNKILDAWYFNNYDYADSLLVESDEIVADRFEISLDDYLEYKNDYYNNSFELVIDELLSKHINSKSDELFYETKMLSSLLCMNFMGIKGSYDNIEFDIKHYPELYEQKYIDFIDKVYGKYPLIQKKLKPVVSKREVI
jgi:hypothetical protein